MVEVQGRALVMAEGDISVLADSGRKRRRTPVASERSTQATRTKRGARRVSAEIDLHGLTVEEALDRAQEALNEALLADLSEVRLIHGRSGGRIRAGLQRRLREIPSVRSFRVDPRNEGVTIVRL
jgi:DNA mismatch repair protein MutS2